MKIGGEYVALYEFESDDPEAIVESFQAAGDAGRMPTSDALNVDDIRVAVLKPIAAYP